MVAMFDYDDTVKAVMQQIKYQGRSRLAYELGLSCGPRVPTDFVEGAEVIVPVPLHFFRKLRRGYNQAAMLAEGLAAGLDHPLPVLSKAVRRQRYTRTQTKLGREKRQSNLAGAFSVDMAHRGMIAGKMVILVDDVVTTGATTGACAKALIEAGAKGVRVFCLARD
jgi:ComF family protein